jgi:hypothetical protein
MTPSMVTNHPIQKYTPFLKNLSLHFLFFGNSFETHKKKRVFTNE